jgi:hypothetical protein
MLACTAWGLRTLAVLEVVKLWAEAEDGARSRSWRRLVCSGESGMLWALAAAAVGVGKS